MTDSHASAPHDPINAIPVTVTVVGAGGAGVNVTRRYIKDPRIETVLFFDTSLANARPGEKYQVLTNGSGSGGNRAENARDIERAIPQLSDDQLTSNDVAIVVFSLSGGTGAVAAPFLIREYAKRGRRVVAVAIADTSYSVGAKNTLNTLKTLTAICKNNDLYLPVILVSNDHSTSRTGVDDALHLLLDDLIDVLTAPVHEVDRNDRLNFLNPTKVVQSAPGLKMLSFSSERKLVSPKIALGIDSQEMVDSLLILQNTPDETVEGQPLPPARFKKYGFYHQPATRIVGKVSSDISAIEGVIDYVERMQHADRSQKHQGVDRLAVEDNGEDLYL